MDTNVVIRYLVQDDARQSSLATKLMEKTLSVDSPGFLSHVVLCEIVWVLEGCYGQSRTQIAAILERLYTAKEMTVQKPELAWKALRALQNDGADFSDALIALVGLEAGCTHTATFDKRAATFKGFGLLT